MIHLATLATYMNAIGSWWTRVDLYELVCLKWITLATQMALLFQGSDQI